MKSKYLFVIGVIALIAVLNINLVVTNENNINSLNLLTNTAVAQYSEDPEDWEEDCEIPCEITDPDTGLSGWGVMILCWSAEWPDSCYGPMDCQMVYG